MRFSCEPLAASALLCSALFCSDASAHHDDPEHPQRTDGTAYTVPGGMHKIGLFSVEYGFTDDLQMITWPFWWHILAPNFGLEWRFVNTDIFDMSFGATGLYVSTRLLTLIFDTLPIADIIIVPADLAGSFVLHEDWTLTVGGLFTGVQLFGSFNDDDFVGAAAVSNLQAHTTLEWKINPTVALTLHGRYLIFQTTKVASEVDLPIDDFTSIHAAGVATSDIFDFPHAFQIVPGVHLSWETFNLTAGLGWGNYIIPAINFVLPRRGPVPQVDIYWRF